MGARRLAEGAAVRWSTYVSPSDGTERAGVLADGALHGLPAGTTLLDLLGDDGTALREAGARALADPAEVVDPAQVVLRAPLPRPPSVRDFMAFEEHIVPILASRGGTLDPFWYEAPVFYFTNPAAVLGPRDDVACAPGSQELDLELEVAVVVGRDGRDLPPEQAEDHIAGYVLMCDWSARDLQRRERGIGLGPVKGKDWATSLGPVLVTADELPTPPGLRAPDVRLTASIDGRQVSDGRLADVAWSFPEMISYASRGTEVRAGDVLGSGTVGSGCIAELAARHGADDFPWLRAGDRVRLDGGPLGAIDVRLVPGAPVHPLRPRVRS